MRAEEALALKAKIQARESSAPGKLLSRNSVTCKQHVARTRTGAEEAKAPDAHTSEIASITACFAADDESWAGIFTTSCPFPKQFRPEFESVLSELAQA